jgi:membrane fusion protein, multidrug efflux system
MTATSTDHAPLVDATTSVAPPKRKPRARIVLVSLVAAFALGGGVVYLHGRGRQSTDDAFVECHVGNVAARLPGQVTRVLARDNQLVDVGAVLVELDDRDAAVKVDAARADLASAKASLSVAEAELLLSVRTIDASLKQARGGITQAFAVSGTSRASIDQAKADVNAAQARASLRESELHRTEQLFAGGALAQAELDIRKSAFDQAAAELAQARARLSGASVGIQNASGSIESAQGHLLAAQAGPEQLQVDRAKLEVAKAHVTQVEAALAQAELNLSYMKIRAPNRGVVSRRSVEVGQMVDPARPLLAISELDDMWVVANFKEDQLAKMRPGQHASVTIDAVSGRTFAAHVESLAGGTGSRFALLPPDNASGNFTKVVQRLPVLLRFDEKPSAIVLRPGLSAVVTVTTG